MPTDMAVSHSFLSRRAALVIAAGLLLLELVLIGAIYKHSIAFNCLANWPSWACSGASGVLVSVYALCAALLLFVVLKPAAVANLTAEAGQNFRPLALNIIGLVIALIPVSFLKDGTGSSLLWPTLALWSVGFGTLILGLTFFVAPWKRWQQFVAADGLVLGGVALAGILAPFFAILIRPLWQLETIAGATFNAVVWTTQLLGYTLDVNDPIKKHLGSDSFAIAVAPQCSGIEGIALVTVFVTIFLALFRKELRFPRAFLLYPAGIAVSMFLNFVRITVLLIIGLEGNSDLAVGGFHSHAGWMMFTVIALGVVLVARAVPALQKAPATDAPTTRAPLPPLGQDMNAARIIPFAVFMLSAILAQAFSQSPGVIYPLRALAMLAVLAFFWPVLARINWRPTMIALLAGAAIGVMWIAVPYNPADTSPSHGGLAGAMLVGWLIARGIGTMLLVPIIEELFFRDYLESKLKGLGGPIIAALITAGLFAILHDRWMEAFVAGLVFSWIMAQRKNVADAIAAHMAANAVVFAYALATMQMHII